MDVLPRIPAKASLDSHNPAGTDGFAFVEFAHADPKKLTALMRAMGFTAIAKHKNREVTIWRQGDIYYVANTEADSYATRFCAKHGPSVVGMGWHMVSPQQAYERSLRLGAKPAPARADKLAIDAPAIEGIGGSLIYFVPQSDLWLEEFRPIQNAPQQPLGVGLTCIDHLTHNVRRGRMDLWFDFYHRLFNFREIHFFNIEGKLTGLTSRALTSPCGRIRIPINESVDDKSQIEEYLRDYHGEGIQHIACGTEDIYHTVEQLRANRLPFMPPPPETYYERIAGRLPRHGEPLERMRKCGILIDGEITGDRRDARLLLQIFSGTVLGPIFFEFIQRKGDDGFGEGNFRALFESIEEDQIRRGVLRSPDAA